MTKTRIKITEHKDGTNVYTAQYKGIFSWECFSVHGIAYRNAIIHFSCAYDSQRAMSLEFAQKIIDKHLELLENERKSADAKKVVSVKYVKYP